MKTAIGIDIGGTKTAGALIRENGQIISEVKIETKLDEGPNKLIQSICSIIEELMDQEPADCIGIGSAGRINIDEGSVFYASNNIPGWTGVKIKEILKEKYPCPIVVENDCKAAGYGELWQGAAKGCKSFVSISLGTGVGAAIYDNGRMLHGAHWSAGELGHVILHPNGRQCNCGLKGCIEQYCSGPALVKLYNEKSNKAINTGYQFFELVKNGDDIALGVLNEFVNDLYNVLLIVFNMFDPEKIIVGGGLIETRLYWWDSLQTKLKESALSQLFQLKVVPAALNNKAAMYGAAYLAFSELRMHALIANEQMLV